MYYLYIIMEHGQPPGQIVSIQLEVFGTNIYSFTYLQGSLAWASGLTLSERTFFNDGKLRKLEQLKK